MKHPIIVLSALIVMWSCEEPNVVDREVEQEKFVENLELKVEDKTYKPLTEKQVKDSTFMANYDRKLYFKSRVDYDTYSFLKVVDRKNRRTIEDTLLKTHEAQNIIVNEFDSTLLVEYNIMTYCQVAYESSVKIKDDRIDILYSKIDNEICACNEDYRYIFEIHTKGKKYDVVTLNGEVIE